MSAEVTFMLDERRVRRMTKLASYEMKNGREDLKISAYFKKDYISLNVISTLLWITVGYLFLAMLVVFACIENLMEAFAIAKIIGLGLIFLIGYIVVLILYSAIARKFYRNKHDQARERVKEYCKNLMIMEKLYEKENAE